MRNFCAIQQLESRIFLDGVPPTVGDAPGGEIHEAVFDYEAPAPVALNPSNPRYFIYNNKPTAMVTSGEHYGAVLNLDFNYLPYLDTLAAAGLNHTRTFSGTYREIPGTFNITRNTLAPAPERYLAPWKRSGTPGYYDGGNKFDLSQWDDQYFLRLKDFVGQAESRGIFVEFTLFCVLYNDPLWSASPMKSTNNINGVGAVSRSQALTLNNGGLLAYQTAFVKKVVTELNSFSNVLFEICNEPYVASYAASDWQRLISSTIRSAENSLPYRHLVTQNIGNGALGTLSSPDPNVDVFQYHYIESSTIYNNHILAKPIGNNETGFDGVGIDTYRHQGWETMLAGGALYSNLDFSFAAGGWESGTFEFPNTTPGSGGAVLRGQLGHLKRFMDSVPFATMSPNNAIIRGGIPSGGVTRALANVGSAYAIYFRGGTQINPIIEMPVGRYKVDWISTKTGKVEQSIQFDHAGGNRTFASPAYSDDIALRAVAIKKFAPQPMGFDGIRIMFRRDTSTMSSVTDLADDDVQYDWVLPSAPARA